MSRGVMFLLKFAWIGDNAVARCVGAILYDLGNGNVNAVVFVVACGCAGNGVGVAMVERIESYGCQCEHRKDPSYRGFEIRTCRVCALDFDWLRGGMTGVIVILRDSVAGNEVGRVL